MKTIAISRHAKSSWEDFSISDIDRPLNQRGKRDAPVMAKKLQETGFVPQQIILSPAQRTLETARHFVTAYQAKASIIKLDQQLYLGEENNYIDAMFGVQEQFDHILMFGHNPGITHIANLCSEKHIANVPTSGILIIEMDIDKWVDANWDNAKLIGYYFPKMIGL